MRDPSSEAGTSPVGTQARPMAGDASALRTFAVSIGICWAILFLVLSARYQLQLYGDGALFSYALAVQETWSFHWHNISGRILVYLLTLKPAEAYVALTGNPEGGIAIYGLLFYCAPLASLAATYALDTSEKRTFFVFACVSTAVLLPLVFGFPTEMWFAHAVFWPLLAYCHLAPVNRGSRLAAAAGFAALFLTHGGGIAFAIAIVATLALRGPADAAFRRAALAFAIGIVCLLLTQFAVRPDPYFADAVKGAALNFIDARNLTFPVMRVLAAAIAAYVVLALGLRALGQSNAHMKAAGITAVALAIYWARFDQDLLAEQRYPLRTALLVFTPLLAAGAAIRVLDAKGAIRLQLPLLQPLVAVVTRNPPYRLLAGALMLVTLVHAVETAKFVVGWSDYKQAVRDLAMSETSNPEMGSPYFTSATRLGEARNQLSWGSTTHFLSVVLAPGLLPRKLVVDPDTNYFWLTCPLATANMLAKRAVPEPSRRLIRTHACVHR